MASSKDIPQTARPSSHRFSVSNSGSLPARSHTRNSGSLSGSLNPNHRVTRRKSVSQNNTNVAAFAAAARDIGDNLFSMPAARRHTLSRSLGKSSMHTPPSSLPSHRHSITAKHAMTRDEDAIEDEEIDDFEDDEESFDKIRQRRASEGGQSLKGDGKKSKDELRCTKCGKGYKHSSCLTKHLWEHTPEWSYTSKLLISKHQQVQLLEAASVLVAMNANGTTPPESAKDFQSDADSASPAASGSSDQREDLSSADTTPPPQDKQYGQSYSGVAFTARNKRYSSGNNYSRSYQSAPKNVPGHAEDSSHVSGFSSRSRQSSERRPLSSGLTTGGQEDEAGLATAIEMLSCSFGTPRTGPVTMPSDVPPVPPLPAQYLGQSAFSGSTIRSSFQGASTSYVRGGSHHDKDVKMEEMDGSVADDDEYDAHSRGRSDEDDDGVFGHMEE